MDNDLATCQCIQEGLQDSLTEVCCITSAAEALTSYMRQDYCLVILNMPLTGMDSMEMLQTMRHIKHAPILVITAFSDAKKIVDYLHAGADTYLEKPLNMDVCAAQANALMRLYLTADMNCGYCHPIIHGSKLIVSPRYRQVMVNGKPIGLTRKEFDLLHYLASYPGQVFSSDQLYRQIWNEEPPINGNDTVKVHIGSLRKKISDIGRDCIHTIWGVGYKFSLDTDSAD